MSGPLPLPVQTFAVCFLFGSMRPTKLAAGQFFWAHVHCVVSYRVTPDRRVSIQTRSDRSRKVRSRTHTILWLCAARQHWFLIGSSPIRLQSSASSGCSGPCLESGRGSLRRAPGGPPARPRAASRSARWSRSACSTGGTAGAPVASDCPTAAGPASVWSADRADTEPSLGIWRRGRVSATVRWRLRRALCARSCGRNAADSSRPASWTCPCRSTRAAQADVGRTWTWSEFAAAVVPTICQHLIRLVWYAIKHVFIYRVAQNVRPLIKCFHSENYLHDFC